MLPVKRYDSVSGWHTVYLVGVFAIEVATVGSQKNALKIIGKKYPQLRAVLITKVIISI